MSAVLITRAAPEAQETAKRVAALGFEPVLSPVLEIEAAPFVFDPAGVQALLFTSAAGVRAFGKADLPVMTVGEAIAEAARKAGFTKVQNADGAGEGLVALAKTLNPNDGALVHISGEDIASDLVGALQGAGYDARRLIAYRARFAAALSPEATELFTKSGGGAVLFHSARGAEAFEKLIRTAGLAGALSTHTALCLSARVAESASTLDFKGIQVASAPREHALLALLGNLRSQRA